MKSLLAVLAIASLLAVPALASADVVDQIVACAQSQPCLEETVNHVLYEADPRNWPCTCDPPREILAIA